MKDNLKLKNDIQQLTERYIVVSESFIYEYFSEKDKEQIAVLLYDLISNGRISKSKCNISANSKSKKSVCYIAKSSGINRNFISSINGNTFESINKSLKVIASLKRYYPDIIHTPAYFPTTIRASVLQNTEEKHIEIIYCTPDNLSRVFFHIENENLVTIRYVIIDGNFNKDKIEAILKRIANIKSLIRVGRTAKDVEYYSPDEYISEFELHTG